MDQRQTAKVAEPITGEKLYQRRARAAFPLLVRQALAGQTIYYSDLAEELGMPNPRNLNYPLGSIGRTLENLSKAWKEKIPPIQCVVINKANQLPGEGIGWFLIKKVEFAELSRAEKSAIVKTELANVFMYRRWREVLQVLGLSPTHSDFSKLNEAARAYGGAGGEGPEHLRLKKYVAANPQIVSLALEGAAAKTEYRFPSGDSLDVSFKAEDEWVAVEVKALRVAEPEIVRGMYQCVKYRALMHAVESSEDKRQTGRALLLLEGKFPAQLVALKNLLGIEVIEGITIPSSFGR